MKAEKAVCEKTNKSNPTESTGTEKETYESFEQAREIPLNQSENKRSFQKRSTSRRASRFQRIADFNQVIRNYQTTLTNYINI